MPVIIPTGISIGKNKNRARVSDKSKKIPPKIKDAGNKNLLSEPIK